MILNSPTISGSLTVTGNIITSGSITISGSIASASYASNADLLDGLDSTVFTLTSSFNAQTASFTAFTASLNAFSASQNSFTASILAQTASLNSFSASILTFTGSASTRLGALESYTSSLNNKTSSFATTGSNAFIGTQTITGSVLQSGSFTSTGTLTAQTLVVQTITSSVVYSSGSNIFGNALNNTQTFTGSVLITGSLALAGNITSNGTAVILGSGTTNYLPKFTGTSTIGNSLIQDDGTNIGIGVTPSTYKLRVNGTGYYSGILYLENNSTGQSSALRFNYNTGNASSRTWQIASDYQAYGDFILQQSTTQTGTTWGSILYFSATGAATFSSSVTATSFSVNTNGNGITFTNTGGAASGKVYQTGADYLGLISGGAGIQFKSSAGTNLVTITDGGNVLIGTGTDYGYKTDIVHSGDGLYIRGGSTISNNPLTIANSSGTTIFNVTGTGTLESKDINITGADPKISLTPTTGTNIFFQKLSTSNGDYLRLYDGTAYAMTWKAANIGIGTSSPVSTNLTGALTIVKSYNADTPTSTTAQAYDTNQSNLYLFGRNAGLTLVGNNGEEAVIAFANASSYYIGAIRYDMGANSTGGSMKFQTGGANERMRITSTGIACFACQVCVREKVYINGSFPGVTLDRAGTSAQSDINWKDAGTSVWSIGTAVRAVGSSLDFYSYSTGDNVFKLSQSGVSCFSGNVCTGGLTVCSNLIKLNNGYMVTCTGGLNASSTGTIMRFLDTAGNLVGQNTIFGTLQIFAGSNAGYQYGTNSLLYYMGAQSAGTTGAYLNQISANNYSTCMIQCVYLTADTTGVKVQVQTTSAVSVYGVALYAVFTGYYF